MFIKPNEFPVADLAAAHEVPPPAGLRLPPEPQSALLTVETAVASVLLVFTLPAMSLYWTGIALVRSVRALRRLARYRRSVASR